MNDVKDIEKRLRNGKLPDSDMSQRHHHVWRKIIIAQRGRRKIISSVILSPWIWALGSIIIVIFFIIYIFFLK